MEVLIVLVVCYYSIFLWCFLFDVLMYSTGNGRIDVSKKGWLLGLIPFYPVFYVLRICWVGFRDYWKNLS